MFLFRVCVCVPFKNIAIESNFWSFYLKFATWNCWSYSNERHESCKTLGYDILALTELHNKQNNFPASKTWLPSANAPLNEQGEITDKAAGVAIMISPRLRTKVQSSGHVGSRISWARINGSVCNIFFVTVYIPHKYRKTSPQAQDVIKQIDALLNSDKLAQNDWRYNCR